MKIVETRWIPRGRFVAITLFEVVLTRNREFLDIVTLNHEAIHCRQQREWLYIPFFVLYLAEWLWFMMRFRNWDRAYRAISFEREAYENASDLGYLNHRRRWQNYRGGR